MEEELCPSCNAPNQANAAYCSSCGALLSRSGENVERLVGTLLGGRFRITRVIAEGGMGVVYAAEQKLGSHVREVAVKTLLPSLSHDHSTVQRFYRESGTVAQLEHPNTIKIFDFGEAPDGSLYIAMEFVRGQPLTDAIEAGAMPVERVIDILAQMCGALHEAHELGIVHRDLKPDNIVLTERAGRRDFVKLLDFGIAARTTATSSHETKLTQQGMVLGTPPYMSPEQFAGEKLDRRSDIYSLGIIAFEMLTGRLPFEAETPWAWAHKHMAEPLPALPRHVPSVVAAAIRRATAKLRDERPATTPEFAQALMGRSLAQAAASSTPALGTAATSAGFAASTGGSPVKTAPNDEPVKTAPGLPSVPLMAGDVAPTAYGPVSAAAWQPIARPQSMAGAPLSVHGAVPGGTPGSWTAPLPASAPLSMHGAMAGGTPGSWIAPLPAGIAGAPPMAPIASRRRGTAGWGVAIGVAALALVAGAAGTAYWLGPQLVDDEPPPVVGAEPSAAPIIELPALATGQNVQVSTAVPAAPRPRPASNTGQNASPAATPATGGQPGSSGTPTTLPTPMTLPIPQLPQFQLPVPTQPTPQPTTQPSPQPTTQAPPQPPPTAQSPSPPPGQNADALCAAARAHANALDIEGAVQRYQQCEAGGGSAGAKNATLATIRAKARMAVRTRANTGQCSAAHSAATSASSIGAGDLAMTEWQNCSCPK